MLWIESGVAALVLASCGGGDAPAPQRLRSEPDAGDERPISVRVAVRLSADGTVVSPQQVAAFLPLRFVVTGDVDGQIVVRGVGERPVSAGRRTVLRSPGLPAGPVRITGPGGTATLRVRPGG